MGPKMRVLEGGWERGRSALEAAYDHYRLELRGNLVSKNTLEHYDCLLTRARLARAGFGRRVAMTSYRVDVSAGVTANRFPAPPASVCGCSLSC